MIHLNFSENEMILERKEDRLPRDGQIFFQQISGHGEGGWKMWKGQPSFWKDHHLFTTVDGWNPAPPGMYETL